MIERLSYNLQVHIPYKIILKSERCQLKHLNQSLSAEYNFIGQFKLSSRMLTILLAYIFRLMEQNGKNKIYFLCESKARCREVKEIAERLKQYYKKNQNAYSTIINMKAPSQQSITSKQQFKLQKAQIIIMQRFFHKQTSLLKDYPHDKYLSILPISEYFNELIQQKLNNPKIKYLKANYLFIETVAFDEIVQTSISGWINQIIIRRAYIQYRKLSKHYHEREDKKKTLQNKNNQLFTSFHKEKKFQASQVQKKINDFFLYKKKTLLKTADKNLNKNIVGNENKKNNQTILEDEALISLDLVGYLINWLQSYQIQTRQFSKVNKEEGLVQQSSSSWFLQMLQKKLLLNLQMIRKLYPILKNFFETYPPVIPVNIQSNQHENVEQNLARQTKTFSTRHILHLTKFFYDLIRFDEVFNQKYNQCIEVLRSSYKQKQKTSFFQIKFRCLNQPLLTQIILQFNEKFFVMMNNGIPFQFYTTVFNPKILLKNEIEVRKIESQKIQEQHEVDNEQNLADQTYFQSQKGFKVCFVSPSDSHAKMHSNIYGFNVTITPSQQNLTIPQLTYSKQEEHDSLIIKAYGVLLFDICQIISDGVIAYFPSFYILNKFKKEWLEKQDIYRRINTIKKIYEETEYQQQNNQLIDQYQKVCDTGRGGIFFITSNGPMAKFISFHGHYSKCIAFLGFPKIHENHKKKETQADKDKEQNKRRENYFNLKQSELQAIYGLKTTAKCLSNCINSIIDPKCVIFADVLYNKKNSKKWFPFMKQGNLSTLQVIQKLKKYYQHSERRYETKLNEQIIRSNSNGSLDKFKQTSLNSSYFLSR